MLIIRLAVLLPGLFCLIAPRLTAESPAPGPAPPPVAEFSFDRDAGVILLPVIYNGREYHFILDTGASDVCFDLSLCGDLEEVKKNAPFGTDISTISAGIFAAPGARFGPIDLKGYGNVVGIDLSSLAPVIGREVHGIIGMSLLKHFIVRLCFDEGQVVFLAPETEPRVEWGTAIPIVFSPQGRPGVVGTVNGDMTFGFVVDSGCTGSGRLSSPRFEKIGGISPSAVVSGGMATDLSGTRKERRVRLRRLDVGPFNYQDLIFTEGNRFTNLGLGFLKRHAVTFDFPRARMHLARGRFFDWPDEKDMSGLHVLHAPGGAEVFLVDPGSPASEAGMKAGDLIIEVNGRSAVGLPLNLVRDILESGHGKKIDITSQRGEEIVTISFRLRRMI